MALGQKSTDSKRPASKIDFSDKLFMIGEEVDTSGNKHDLCLFFQFYRDGSATFRVKRGEDVISNNPLRWRFSADSLQLQPEPISLEAEEKIHQIERETTAYFVVRVPTGYLLKGKSDQMLLIEQK